METADYQILKGWETQAVEVALRADSSNDHEVAKKVFSNTVATHRAGAANQSLKLPYFLILVEVKKVDGKKVFERIGEPATFNTEGKI